MAMLKLPEKQQFYWRDQAPAQPYPPLNEDLEVDTVIIGGGICGLSCAYLLKLAGQTVAVLERNSIGSGTTGATTGKVTSQHNLFYADLANHLGGQTARLYGQANQAAIDQINVIIKQAKIDCGWQRAPHYVYTSKTEQVKKFKQEAKVASELGLPASFEPKAPLPFKTAAAVKFDHQANFNAQAYANGLAKAVAGDGSFVFGDSPAVSIRDGLPATVETNHRSVIAKDIIVATNVPTWPLVARLTYCLLEYPTTSYIVAVRAKAPKGMFISPDNDNFSILPVQNNLVLIGGGSHIRGPRSGDKRWQQLADFAEQKLGATSVEYKWSAWDYIAYDGMPVIGKAYPWSQHLYVATAFKKWGLTNTTVAAMVLRDLITGQPNQWANLFTPHRWSPVRSIPRVALSHLK